MKDLPMLRTDEEVLDPKSYLKLTEEQKSNIKEAKIIPPKLGESDFGKIKVKFRNPSFKLGFS